MQGDHGVLRLTMGAVGISKDACAAAGSWRSFGKNRQQLRGSELLPVAAGIARVLLPLASSPLDGLRVGSGGPCAQLALRAPPGSLGSTSAEKSDRRCGG